MRKIIGSGVMLLGLFSIILLFPQIELNAGPQIIPKNILRSALSLRKNVTIQAMEIGTREPIVDKYLQIYKYILRGSRNYVSLSHVISGRTDENGEFKVRLPRDYLLDASEATLDGQVSSYSYFIRAGEAEMEFAEPHPKRYYEFNMGSLSQDDSDEKQNYPEVSIIIWFPSPDRGTH